MIQLAPYEHDAMRWIVGAGADGYVLDGRSVRLSTAIRLEMAGMARLENGGRIKVYATAQGRAFHFRSAA